MGGFNTWQRRAHWRVDVHRVNKVPFDAAWKWLAAGSRDMWRVPHVSLAYGAIFTLISLTLVVGLYLASALSLVLPLAGGVLLPGPMIAVGLYETSRRLEEGEPVTLSDIVSFSTGSLGQNRTARTRIIGLRPCGRPVDAIFMNASPWGISSEPLTG